MALALALDPLDGAAELDVHVAVDADEAAGVLGLAPLEADADVVVDERLQHGPRVHGDELCEVLSLVVWEGMYVGGGFWDWDWGLDLRSWLWLCEGFCAGARVFVEARLRRGVCSAVCVVYCARESVLVAV